MSSVARGIVRKRACADDLRGTSVDEDISIAVWWEGLSDLGRDGVEEARRGWSCGEPIESTR